MPWDSATVSAAVISDAFQHKVTVSIPGWEGVEKGSKSENLPLNIDFAACGKQGARHSNLAATPGRRLLQNQAIHSVLILILKVCGTLTFYCLFSSWAMA
jgi:hypothetical protein